MIDRKYWTEQTTGFLRTTAFINSIRGVIDQNAPLPVFLVDAGCSEGVSTIELRSLFPTSHVVYGVDINLEADADYRQKERTVRALVNQGELNSEDTRMIKFLENDYYKPVFRRNSVDIFLILNSINYLYRFPHDFKDKIPFLVQCLGNAALSLNPNKGRLILGKNGRDSKPGNQSHLDYTILERVGDEISLKGDEQFYAVGEVPYTMKLDFADEMNKELKFRIYGESYLRRKRSIGEISLNEEA